MNLNSDNSKRIQSRILEKAVGPKVGSILRLLLDGQKVRLHSAVKIILAHGERVIEPGSGARDVEGGQ